MSPNERHPDPDRLALVPLFSGLSVHDRTRLASWMEVEEFNAGRRLTEEGAFDYKDCFGEVLHGRHRLSCRGLVQGGAWRLEQ